MSDIRGWFRIAASNAAASPDGNPELMPRSGVNDSARETAAAIKRYYDQPDFRRPFESYAMARVSGTHFTLTDVSPESNAAALMEVGQRVRMTVGSDVWEGFITDTPAAPVYAAPITTFYIEWILADSKDVAGPITLPTYVEVSFQEIGRAAWYDTGASAGKIPLFDDLDAHVIKPEATLDVGFVDGVTREEMEMAGARGRMNANGGMGVWQRGDSFTAATPYTNAADNVCADNWTIISDGDDRVDVTRDQVDFPLGIGVHDSMLLTAATVPANQKHGVVTFIELEDGGDVADLGATDKFSISLWVKLGGTTGIDTLRAYVLNIKNREPTVAPVSAWASGTAGTNVTFNATDWELPSPATKEPFLEIPLTGNWARFVIEDLSLDQFSSGTGGIAIAIITDDASIISGAQWRLAAVQGNYGSKALPFIVTPAAVEHGHCLRYFESTFDEQMARPDDGAGVSHALVGPTTDTGSNNSLAVVSWQFAVPKFKLPAIQTYNPGGTPAVADEDWYDGTLDYAIDTNTVTRKISHLSCSVADRKKVLAIAAVAHANIWGAN